MTARDAARTWGLVSPRPPIDDAYTAWFNAHSRCALALRAWNAAMPESRASAFFAYQAELDIEEEAARTLEHLNRRAAG